METELENLVYDFRYGNGSADYSPLYTFFSKVLQKNQILKITPKIKENIPFLSTCDSGLLWPIAQQALPDFKPSMLVPDLDVKSNPFVPAIPPRLACSPRPRSIPTKLQLPVHPMNLKTIHYVPAMTTREVLPALATSIPGQFYYCSPKTAKNGRGSSMSFKVHRKKLPPIPLTSNQRIFNLHGLMQISPKYHGEFTPMKLYLYSKEKLFMSSRIPVFKNWIVNKMFIRWYYNLRMKRYLRIKNIVLNSCPFGHTEFFEIIMDIRKTVNDVFTQCHPISPEKGQTEAFSDLVQNSNESLKEMKQKMKELEEILCDKVTHFIFQVNGIARILSADYEILKTIDALPQPLIKYSLEDKDNRPSMTGSQIRTKLLIKERRRAYDRMQYLPQFFMMVRLFLRDFFVKQLHYTLTELYFRFTESPPTKAHQIRLVLNPNKGLVLSPSREEFINWFNIVDKAVKKLFICDQLTLPTEVMDSIFPNHDCPECRIIKNVALNDEMETMKKSALQVINDAYDHFEKKLKPSAILLIKLQKRLDEIEQIRTFVDSDHYVSVAKETIGFMTDVDQLARIATFGSLYSDMKEGKSSGFERIQKIMKDVKDMGIAKAKALYDDIIINRNEYMKNVSINKMRGIETETSDLIGMKKDIKEQCLSYLPLAQCIVESWSSDVGVVELEGQIVSVKEILVLVNPPKPPRSKRVKKVARKAKKEGE